MSLGKAALVAVMLVVCACTLVDPQLKGESAVPAIRPAGMRATPIRFGRLEGRLRHGAEIGRYTWGILCKPPYRMITWEMGRRLIGNREFPDVFYDALTGAGYDVAGDPGRMYDEEEDAARAELIVSGQVDEIAIDLCRRYDWWMDGYTGYTGAGLIRINWTVYNKLERRAVYHTSTSGFGKVEETTPDARELILESAFADAAAKLGKETGFHDVVFVPAARTVGPALESVPAKPGRPATGPVRPSVPRPAEPRPESEGAPNVGPDYQPPPETPGLSDGMSPDPAASTRAAKAARAEPERRSGEDDPEAQSDKAALGAVPVLRLSGEPARAGAMTANAEDLVRATVVISTSVGEGSGFFIAEDPAGGGWIVTNAHVVGDAERVRVSTANRRARIGTVIRRHRIRDVALVHVDGSVPAVAGIRDEPVSVGEEVFAVGAPLGGRNRDTVSRGIVSRLGKERDSRLPLIQSDVMIQPGNSGGPLLDASGNVVGLCVSGIGVVSLGLNFFIPIADALDKLKVDLAAKP